MLTELSRQIYDINAANGFWDEPREIGTLLMLATSELAEALEADRKDKWADMTGEDRAFLEEMTAFKYANPSDSDKELYAGVFDERVKDSFEDEIADAIIRLLDISAGHGIDIDFHVKAKMAYNATREYKHGKRY